MMGRTVTLYRKQPGQPVCWERQVIEGVFFRTAEGTALSEQGVQGGQLGSLLIIPADLAEAPKPGDGVLFGAGPEADGPGDIRELVPGCRLIAAVTGRCYGSDLDHWEVAAR